MEASVCGDDSGVRVFGNGALAAASEVGEDGTGGGTTVSATARGFGDVGLGNVDVNSEGWSRGVNVEGSCVGTNTNGTESCTIEDWMGGGGIAVNSPLTEEATVTILKNSAPFGRLKRMGWPERLVTSVEGRAWRRSGGIIDETLAVE